MAKRGKVKTFESLDDYITEQLKDPEFKAEWQKVGQMPKRETMKTLEAALDAASYEWLVSNLPDVAQAIEAEVTAGAQPSEIKTAVLRHTGRLELALRCEQAARWLVGA